MSLFALPEKKLFFSKNDREDLRLGDVVTADANFESIKDKLVIVGYPDDRGVQANGGRIGAKDGPTGIRQILYKLVAPAAFHNKLADIGDFSKPTELENDQTAVIRVLDILNTNGNRILSLGGGHDWAFCDVSSFITREMKNKQRPLVINIDAHLDVRSDKNGVNSGTSFFKVLEKFPGQFDLIQIGIQPQCNSKKHLQYSKSKAVEIVMKDDVETKGIRAVMDSIVTHHAQQPVFLSLDIDAITASEAPGCSQSWPDGLTFSSVKYLLTQLNRFSSWNHLGIYEVAPSLDVQNITQKSAALAAYEFIVQSLGSQGV
jgi:formiminoglutamase